MDRFIRLLTVAIVTSGLQFNAAAHNHTGEGETQITVTKLGTGLHEIRTDRSGNTVIMHGADGLVIVDTPMVHLAKEVKGAIRDIAGTSEATLIISTHMHRDHVASNGAFRGDATMIVAHPNVRRYLEAPKAIRLLGRTAPQYDESVFPSIGIGDSSVIFMNGETITIRHAPNAHTNGDIFLHFRNANVIHAGDLLYSGRFPFIDIDNGGTVSGFIAGMQYLLTYADENTKIVAGHGPISTKSDVEESITMLSEAYRLVEDLVEADKTLVEIKEIGPLSKFAEKWDWAFIDSERMTDIMYYDLTGSLD
jgi:glyoxylase-like metal-dependent hydrolase (beta-lactamase superfamily II)